MNFEQRANIKFCFKLGKTFTETHNLMKQVYGDNCVARASVYEWYTRFRWISMFLLAYRSSRHEAASVREKLKQIHSQIHDRMKIRSERMKVWYDQKAKQIQFREGQKVWLFNPRKKKGRNLKLQSN
ncbi:GVQW3 protein, partial [Acromyrmex insinuator]